MRNSKGERILWVTGLLTAAAAAALPALIVPYFRTTFASLGMALPFITRLFVHYNAVFWLLPALSLAAWLYWPTPHRRALVSCLIGSVSLVVMMPLLIAAMYLPIFRMDATI